MQYDMPLYRPPSEARSLIFQVTLGCSHNRCAYCVMYRTKKFCIRPWEDVKADILEAALTYREARRIFLADGDAMAVDADHMVQILELLYETFPYLERVSAYANPSNLLDKTLEELTAIREAGLQMLYFGVESGDEELLKKVRKGATSEEIVRSGKKAIDAGFLLSATVILGLGGREGSDRHAQKTARICSAINPQYLSALTLLIEDDNRYFYHCLGDDWEMMDKLDFLKELRTMIEHFELKRCIFRSNHASNYLPIKAVLNEDKDQLLAQIDHALQDPTMLRPESMRAL